MTGAVLASSLVAASASAATKSIRFLQKARQVYPPFVKPGDVLEFSVSEVSLSIQAVVLGVMLAVSCNNQQTPIRYKIYNHNNQLIQTFSFYGGTKRLVSKFHDSYRIVLSDSYYSDNRGSIRYTLKQLLVKRRVSSGVAAISASFCVSFVSGSFFFKYSGITMKNHMLMSVLRSALLLPYSGIAEEGTRKRGA